MTLPLFYEPDLSEQTTLLPLSEESARHCLQVLRMREGESVEITNGRGLSAIGHLLVSGKRNAQVQCISFAHHLPAPVQLTLCLSPLKNPQRLEWLLEKATEIGMAAFQPIICQRTEQLKVRSERLKSILISAMLQSRQYFLPELLEPISFSELMQSPPLSQQWIAHCSEGEKLPLAGYPSSGNARILIGPEGDFTHEEINAAIGKGYRAVSLGNTRLRTETAGLVAVTLIIHNNLVNK